MEMHYATKPQDTVFHCIKCQALKGISLLNEKIFSNKNIKPDQLEIIPLTVPCNRLDPSFNKYRIIQISDIHMGTWINYSRLENIISIINQQYPDLIVITGDLITDFRIDLFESMTDLFRLLKPKDAVLAVRGNHDCWIQKSRFQKVLLQGGVIDISNAFYTIYRGKACLHIAGVDDVRYGHDCLDGILSTMPAYGAAILLAHEPDFADTSALTDRFDLQLSGHSHGGQVVLPLIGSPFLPQLGRKYPKGRYQVNGMVQYTNRGIGTASIQFRYQCPAEVTIITLQVF
jgi:predicted MPP superfamily phosphohydrolase